MRHWITLVAAMGIVIAIPFAANLMPVNSAPHWQEMQGAANWQDPESSVVPQATSVYIVDGTIRNGLGSPVSSALVTVKMMNGATVTGTQTYTTSTDGFYTVTFAPAEWDPGYTISVTATRGPDSGFNSTLATIDGFATIDVSIGPVIPEFGAPMVVGGSFVAIALAVAFSRKRRAVP